MRNNYLFILPFLPWPMKSGGHQAIFNGLLSLGQDANIYIVYPAPSLSPTDFDHQNQLRNEIKGIKDIIPYVPNKKAWSKRKFLIRIWNKIIRNKFSLSDDEAFMEREGCIGPANLVSGIHDLGYYELISNTIQKFNIDVVQVEMLTEIDAVVSIPKNVKKIFVHHELGYIRKELAIKNQEANLLKRVYAHSEKAKEIYFLNCYDLIVTLSESDKIKLEESGVKTKIHPSFAVVNNMLYEDCVNSYSFNGILTFVGPEGHSPNRQGLKWFLDNVWVKIKQTNPVLEMHIIGLWTEETIKSWSSQYNGIVFRGFVDNLALELQGSTMVVPIFVGSGIRMKILEAMSIGVPFVSTTVGAEGIPVKDGEGCYITDSTDTFIQDILNLQDENLRKQFIISSRELVSSSFSFDRFKEDRISVYKELLEMNNPIGE